MSGQVRKRTRDQTYGSPWCDWLLVSKGEMKAILDSTGWGVRRFFGLGGNRYIAVIEKEP